MTLDRQFHWDMCEMANTANGTDSPSLISISALLVSILALASSIWSAYETRRTSKEQIRMNAYLQFQERFDSKAMVLARRKLATSILTLQPIETYQERVLNFFEDLGIVYRTHEINRKLAENTFGFYAVCWHLVLREYIKSQRERYENDPTIFEEFEIIASEFKSEDAPVTVAMAMRCVQDELEAD